MNPQSGPQLRDIHLPAPPGWWPLAVGWWIIIGVVLVAIAALAIALWRRRIRRRRAQAPLRELDGIAARWHASHDSQSLAAALSQLLRRAARRHDASTATLSGDAWLASLQAMAPRIPLATLAPLEASIYQPASMLDADSAIDSTRRWLRHVMSQPGGRALHD